MSVSKNTTAHSTLKTDYTAILMKQLRHTICTVFNNLNHCIPPQNVHIHLSKTHSLVLNPAAPL